MKSIYWLTKEDFAITKYDSLLGLLNLLECPHIAGLKTSKCVDNSSD
jgi:hypothetical protein